MIELNEVLKEVEIEWNADSHIAFNQVQYYSWYFMAKSWY